MGGGDRKPAAGSKAPKIELRSIEKLIPYERNARTHSPEQIAQIAASIREFGWTNPVLLDGNGGIIAGHGRLLAAQQLGLKSAPVIVLDHLSEAQKRAYIIADNQLALNAGWDLSLLAGEIQQLQTDDFDLSLLGFDATQLDNLLTAADGTEGLTDPDEVPETPVEPVTQAGDLWILGKHRLLCGDATKREDVERLMNGLKPHLMVTDPPYGVKYDANWRNEADRANGKPFGARAVGKVLNDDRCDWREAWSLFPGNIAYVWHAGRYAKEMQESLEASGFQIRNQIIWAKNGFVISRGDYHWQHEPCWYAVKGKGFWTGDRSQSTLWQIAKPLKSETGHSAQKPVECMRRPLKNNSSPGQAIYDPFCGSGSTVIAAETEGRHCLSAEIDPPYCDVIVTRWQNFTGQTARLDGTKQTFDQLKEKRTAAA